MTLTPERPPVPAWKLFALLLAFLPGVLLVEKEAIRRALDDPAHPDWVLAAWPGDRDAETSGTLRVEGDWKPVGRGLTPAKPPDAAMVVSVPAGGWDRLRARVVGADESTWWLRVARDYQSARVRIENDVEWRWKDKLPGFDGSTSPIEVRIEPRSPGRASDAMPQLRRLELRLIDTRANPPVPFPGFVALGLLPLAGALFAWLRTRLGAPSSAVIGVLLGLAGAFYARARPEAVGGMWVGVMGLAVASAAVCLGRASGYMNPRRGEPDLTVGQFGAIAHACILGALLLAGLDARWDAFELQRRSPLDPDAAGFIEIALRGGGLYATEQAAGPWLREPFFPWLLRLWFLATPHTNASARVLSVLVSLAMVGAVYGASIRVFGRTGRGLIAALAATGVLALHPDWVDIAPRVLREDLSIFLLAGMIAARIALAERSWWRAGVLAALGSALVLTRISGLALVVPVLGWEAWRQRWRAPEIALAAALVAVPLLPHLAFNYQWRGRHDALASSSVHARYYINAEFAGRPGFPSREEVRRDAYAGGPAATREYLGLFSPGEILRRHAIGFWNMLAWRFPRERLFFGHEWLMLPGLVGAWVFVRDRRLRWLLAWFALALLPFAFIHGATATWRLGASATVIVMWVWAAGVAEAMTATGRRLAWVSPKPAPPHCNRA